MSSHRPLRAWVFDLILGALLIVYVLGAGLHAPDVRRAWILLAAAGALFVPALRQESVFLKAFQSAARALEASRARWGLWGAGLGVACFLAVLQTLAIRYPLYDVGIFHQIIWAVGHGHGFVSTISGAGQFLLDHFSPSLALLTPFFWATGSAPWILPILHALLVYGGIAAWIWLAERAPGIDSRERSRLAAAVTVFAVFFDSLWGNLRWGFHETAIAFAASSWALALLLAGTRMARARKDAIAGLLFLVAALSKEILLVDVAVALSVWAALDARKERRVGFAAFLVMVAIGLMAGFVYFEKLPHPADKNYFDRYYAYLGRDLGTFAKTLLLSPWKIIENVGAGEIARFFRTVFAPFFLPILVMALFGLSPRRREWLHSLRALRGVPWIWLLAVGPSFASALLATYPPLRGGYYHYVLELWPFLGVLTVLALARIGKPALSWAWAILAVYSLGDDPVARVREYIPAAMARSEVRTRLSAMPASESVLADELAGPWVASRLLVARAPDLQFFKDRCPDWIVLQGDEGLASARAMELVHACAASARKSVPELALQWKAGEWIAFRVR